MNAAADIVHDVPASDHGPGSAIDVIVKPSDARRERLLRQVGHDRAELIDVARDLRGPARTLQTAGKAIALTARSLRWIALAGEAITLASWIRSGRRPPLPLLLGISVHLFTAWSKRSTAPRPSRDLPRNVSAPR